MPTDSAFAAPGTTPAHLTDQVHPRVAVIGDVGGHTHALRRILEQLGVRFDLPYRHSVLGTDWAHVHLDWPAGLVIVQAGDLIHRGPDSLGVVVLVDRLLREGRWVQVVGNHEQLYVDKRVFGWPEVLDDHAAALLRSWWAEDLMRPAAALVPATEDDPGTVVTHAGITAGFHAAALDQPATAAETAAAVNALAGSEYRVLWWPGLMLGYEPNPAAGPVWAEAGHEVYASWVAAHAHGRVPGFHQAHGHSSAFKWSGCRWQAPDLVRDRLRVDTGRRHVRFSLDDVHITGIDPGHSKVRSRVWAPLELTDVRIS